jgi:ornithine cyclodeaminase/alanine dehydrogenase-like protein (mu-crystallin family)
VHQPLRMVVKPPGAAGMMALMPAYQGGERPAIGLKAVGIFPGNAAHGRDPHQGAVLLFDGATGQPQAVADASAITQLRTAAVSAVATDLLANPDAGDLALIGAGGQARSHLVAMATVRRLRRVRVTSRDPEHGRRFAAELAGQSPVPIEVLPTVAEAVAGADLVVTATDSHTPVLRRRWLADGVHVNAVGASLPTAREVDSATMAAARVYVDRRESTLAESGDYLLAVRDGAIGPGHLLGELGELLAGAVAGRTSTVDITLFKSLGLAVEDLATVAHLYDRARQTGAGTWVPF